MTLYSISTMMPPGQAHYNMDVSDRFSYAALYGLHLLPQWPLYAGLSSEAVADLAITTALCVCFSHLRQAVDT